MAIIIYLNIRKKSFLAFAGRFFLYFDLGNIHFLSFLGLTRGFYNTSHYEIGLKLSFVILNEVKNLSLLRHY